MKSIFSWFIGCTAMLLSFSCESFLSDNMPPIILVNGGPELTDTIKRTANPVLTFEFTVTDDQLIRDMLVLNVQKGLLWYDNKIINDVTVDISAVQKGTLQYEALKTGSSTFTLEVKDEDNRSSTAQVSIVTFDNLAPVAMLSVQQTDELSPHQVKIDATNSFDKDQPWGGAILQWEFTIEGFYTTVIDRPVIQYIFPEAGKYTFGLRVKDNDQIWSEKVTKEIMVQ